MFCNLYELQNLTQGNFHYQRLEKSREKRLPPLPTLKIEPLNQSWGEVVRFRKCLLLFSTLGSPRVANRWLTSENKRRGYVAPISCKMASAQCPDSGGKAWSISIWCTKGQNGYLLKGRSEATDLLSIWGEDLGWFVQKLATISFVPKETYSSHCGISLQ